MIVWIEVTSVTGKKVLVNFDNVVRIDPIKQDRWMLTFIDREITRLSIIATAAQLNGLLSIRR